VTGPERVLVLSSTFPQFEDDPRGAFLRAHWEAQAAAGKTVRVLAPRTAWSRDDFSTPLQIARFRYAPRIASSLTGRFGILENLRERAWRALLLAPYLAASRLALRRQLREFEPDLVVAHMFLPSGWSVAHACARRGVPFEVYGHGTDVDVCLRAPRWIGRRLLAPLQRARAVYLPSHDKLERVVAALGLGEVPAAFGVDAMAHAAPKPPGGAEATGGDRVLFMGRLIHQKGVADLLLAAAKLDGVPVDIAGDGPLRSQLERQAHELGIDATFHGFVGGQRKWELFREAALLCVPSRDHDGLSEGAPLVIEEARAVGLPVVAYSTGGIPELCRDSREATLVEPGDAVALAHAMREQLEAAAECGLRRAG
jgi:glycosyltransferase involved in cell wall biosynthesis